MNVDEDKLLSITKAAKFLGVHPLTLRNWTAKGQIPFFRTPGGHRRFKQSDLIDFLATLSQGSTEAALVTTTQQKLRQAMANYPLHSPAIRPVWQQQLTDKQRATMRSLGKMLLGTTLHYAAGLADESTLEKGRELGRAYGQTVRENDLSLTEAVATFNFFRDTMIDSTFQSPQSADVSQSHLYQRLNHFFNEVLLAMIRAAEDDAVK